MFADIHLTWLGHATFLVETPYEETLLVDPWLAGNPKCPADYEDVESDAMLITHGHADHIGDVFDAQANCSGPVVGIFEMATWLEQKGIDGETLEGINKGGTIHVDEIRADVTMVDAHHSSSFVDDGEMVYLGEPAGYVVRFSGGDTIYFAGDTSLFGDMKLIGERHEPDVAVLPIGDRFTMDPTDAAKACEFLGVETVVPCHWGTFDALTGTPDELEEAIDELDLDTTVAMLKPGETW
jgi:L-ascorbate metabolism protein UlaG (beta-lactamase superfamily)